MTIRLSALLAGLCLLAPIHLAYAQTSTPPEITAASAITIDAQTGRILFAKNIDEKRQVASTQKLLTGLIIAESGNLDGQVRVEATDMKIEPRNLWITTGSRYKKRALLEAMLIRSYNDVTKCLARSHAGSQAQFAKVMNAKAAQLGMTNSNFVNAHGLTEEGQYSTARDMMVLTMHAWANPEIQRIVRIRETNFKYHGGKTVPVKNSNELLFRYSECLGMKTGFTKAAGRCLVAAAQRGDRLIFSVVLGSEFDAIWDDSEQLLRWSLEQNVVDLEKYRTASVEKWGKDIAALQQRDQTERHPDDSILFVGSSSIRLWDAIARDMQPYHPIQRGFGGCTMSDVAIFADELVTPHKFRAAVVFVANDVKGNSDDKTPAEVADLFGHLHSRIRAHNPDAPVFFIGITPTPKRWAIWPKQREVNTAVRAFCQKNDETYFIGTESIYITAQGKPRSELFIEDQLHLNESGYLLWSAAIKSHLDQVFDGSGVQLAP